MHSTHCPPKTEFTEFIKKLNYLHQNTEAEQIIKTWAEKTAYPNSNLNFIIRAPIYNIIAWIRSHVDR